MFLLVQWSVTTKSKTACKPAELCEKACPYHRNKNASISVAHAATPLPSPLINKGQWLSKMTKSNTPHKPWQHRERKRKKERKKKFKNSPHYLLLVCLSPSSVLHLFLRTSEKYKWISNPAITENVMESEGSAAKGSLFKAWIRKRRLEPETSERGNKVSLTFCYLEVRRCWKSVYPVTNHTQNILNAT